MYYYEQLIIYIKLLQ
ncbi:hypothetical protein PVPAM_000027100 [Plasmodium vivax]|nr:hypothetical protein PVPAM_000027100 [Plasmodium vivax]